MKKKTILKDILNVTITEAKKSVKELTDRQLTDMVTKVNKLYELVSSESNARFTTKLEAEVDQEFDNIDLEDSDEV